MEEKEEITNAFIWGETNEYQKEQFDIILYNSSNDYYDKTYKK